MSSDLEWYSLGLCSPTTQYLFFDVSNNGRFIHVDEAKAMCDQCPVEVKCADDAMNDTFRKGIWGGMTEGQRSVLRALHISETEAFYASISPAVESVVLDVQEETMRRMQGIL